MPSKGFSRLDAFILTDCTFHQRGFSVALSLSRSWRKQKAPETERKREYASILIKRARQTFFAHCYLECVSSVEATIFYITDSNLFI